MLPALVLLAGIISADEARGAHPERRHTCGRGRTRPQDSLREALYVAPPECPDAQRFIEDVASRAKTSGLGPDALPRAQIARTGALYQGTVVVGSGKSREARFVSGKTCAAVERALALIAALSLDAAPEPSDPPPQSGANRAGVDDASQPPAGGTDGPKDIEASAAGRRVPIAAVDEIATEPAAPEPWRVDAGAGALGLAGILPSPALAGAAFVEAGASARVRLTFLRSARSPAPAGSAPAHFALTAARIDLCPYRLDGGPVSISPCATVAGGRLDAADAPRSSAAPYLAPGALLRVQLALWEPDGFGSPSARGGRGPDQGPVGAIFAELEAGGEAPILRDHFYLAPAATVHDVSTVAARAAIALGVRIW